MANGHFQGIYEVLKMIKKIVTLLGLSAISVMALGADPLHGTKWKTIDDQTKKPLSVVEFRETNGVLTAKIVDVLTPGEAENLR